MASHRIKLKTPKTQITNNNAYFKMGKRLQQIFLKDIQIPKKYMIMSPLHMRKMQGENNNEESKRMAKIGETNNNKI